VFRSWNLRYAASAAAGFVAVVALSWFALSTGVVSLGDASSGPTALAPASGDASPGNNVSRIPESPFMNRTLASPVSEGIHGPFRRTTREGAIATSNSGLDLDSLIRMETINMTDEERVEYLQKRIDVMNRHLDQYQEQRH
jgi:hypothetical protein